MTMVKICGITRLGEARAALEAGADLLGFVFYRPVRRYVAPERAAEIIARCRRDVALAERRWKAVGVFVNAPLEELNAICERCRLDLVQVCGEEDPDYCSRLVRPAIRVLRAGTAAWTADRLEAAQRGYRVERFLVDAHVDGFYGGTGQTADWDSLAGLMGDKILAGGLRPDNVRRALDLTRPWGVDVSSGVERDGRKDAALVRAFIEQVRRFDREAADRRRSEALEAGASPTGGRP